MAPLQGMVDLLVAESARNPAFAEGLDALLAGLPEERAKTRKARTPAAPVTLPDIHAEWTARGEHDFRTWLARLPAPVLKAIIGTEDFDAARRTSK